MTDTGLQKRLLTEARALTASEIRTRKASVWFDEASDEYILEVGPSFKIKPIAVTIDATEELAELSDEAHRQGGTPESCVARTVDSLEARLMAARGG